MIKVLAAILSILIPVMAQPEDIRRRDIHSELKDVDHNSFKFHPVVQATNPLCSAAIDRLKKGP